MSTSHFKPEQVKLKPFKKSHASAPGKLIVCGEYAVLQAYPAWVLAVDRRVHIRIEQHAGNDFEIHARGLLTEPEVAQRLADGRVQAKPDSKLAMLVELFNVLAKYYWQAQSFPVGGWSLQVDSSELFDQQQKLGLGSSAAMTVALDEALKQLALSYGLELNTENQEQRWLRLHLAHSAAQGKRGSGVDIAASLVGGVTRFCNHQDTACELSTISLPDDLSMAFIWSGKSASTPAYLRSLTQWRTEHSAEFDQFMLLLGEASSAALSSANREQKSTQALMLLQQFTAHLKAFDKLSELGIFASGHQDLSELAAEYEGLVYKPCGAGGGDLGLALSAKPEQLNEFSAAIEQGACGALGARRVHLNIDAEGVRFYPD